jgi:Ca2+-binding RTX toxin-like protein
MRPGGRWRSLDGMIRSPHPRRLIPLLAALTILLPAASATAGTVTREGDQLVFRAAPGEANDLFLNREGDQVVFNDAEANAITVAPGTTCEHADGLPASVVRCAAAGAVRAELGDGDDILRTGYDWPASMPISGDGGPGNDQLTGGPGSDVLTGGDGNDKLKGADGDDQLDGGSGNDDLDGGAGRDAVHGGDGDDTLAGDPGSSMSADVLDGGPGRDTLSEYEYADGSTQRPVHITLDAGGADDGRPGEGDEITGIEVVHLLVAADMTAGNAGADLKVFHTLAAPSRLIGGPGNDVLTGFDYDDTINGGPGDDLLIGGYGHDTITGGPGRDTINADAVDGCNFLECRPIYGNDTIDVRDGEVDNVTCGPGTDRVIADAIDIIAPDCENVERPTAGGGPAPGGGRSGGTRAPATRRRLAVSAPRTLAARALRSRRGVTVKVTVPGAGKVALTLARGAKGTGGTAAAGSAKAKASGRVGVRLRAATGAQRGRLGRGSYRLTVRWTPARGGAQRATVTLKVR